MPKTYNQRELKAQSIKRLEAEYGPDNWFVKALKQQHDSVSQKKSEAPADKGNAHRQRPRG